ncbi:MAG: class I SAM-dependent methyltransferase [Parcubacteria group bacterium]|nr:class I SAM-dependent methyltransferase [Parcubacteria group bacterium]
MGKNTLRDVWDMSYKCGDNFLFYPHEEIVRFANAYVKKRIGATEYKPIGKVQRVLDLGCGIGRHVWYFDEMNIETYGIDISKFAIESAKKIAHQIRKEHLIKRFLIMSGAAMKFQNSFFDVIVSHGTLDSMPFVTAKKTMREAVRVLSDGGYMYIDLISGDESRYAREFNGEIIVKDKHERNTVQSFFNYEKIHILISGTRLKPVSIKIKKDTDVLSGIFHSRWHCVLQKTRE